MVVFHKDEGWSAYCHRCGEPGFVARPKESLAERLARVKAQQEREATAQRSIVPPLPPVCDVTAWPLSARVWLYKAGFSNDDIARVGIYYHEQTDRVVVPMLDEHGVLVYWQARAHDWHRGSDREKYLNPYQASTEAGIFFPADGPVILTEDYLSAYRVSRAGWYAGTLLGTKLRTKVLARLVTEDRRVGVWMDNDLGRMNNPGQEAAAKIVKSLRSYGLDVVNIVSDRDPKQHSRKEIQCLLTRLFSPS